MSRPQLRTRQTAPFAGRDVPTLIDSQARLRGDQPFVIWAPPERPEQVWTFSDFSRDSAAIAAGLAAMGVGQGDRVLLLLANCPEMLLAWAACARLGAIVVPLNTAWTGSELEFVAEHTGAVGAITQQAFAGVLAESAPDLGWLVVVDPGAETNGVAFADLRGDPERLPGRDPDPWAPMSISYTSGSTARPKGVVWTHGNVLWAARSGAGVEQLTAQDRLLLHLPLFHINAMSCGFMTSLWAGASIVLQPGFSASRFWDLSLRHGCTWTSMIPFCVNALVGQVVPEHNYRLWAYTANDPDVETRFGVKTIGWWGMTETTTVALAGSPIHDNTATTVGTPVPGYEIAVLRADMTPTEPGESGELRVRAIPGVSLFQEYWADPAATEAAFDEDGFLITGDVVTVHADGTITYTDRMKDILKVGGENVSAFEIEQVAIAVPGCSEAAVVGRPDHMLDMVPVLFVIADQDTDPASLTDLLDKSMTPRLASFKRPREIRIVETLPRAAMNKVSKVALREQLAADRPRGTG